MLQCAMRELRKVTNNETCKIYLQRYQNSSKICKNSIASLTDETRYLCSTISPMKFTRMNSDMISQSHKNPHLK